MSFPISSLDCSAMLDILCARSLRQGVGGELRVPSPLLRGLHGQGLHGLDSEQGLGEEALVGSAPVLSLTKGGALQGRCGKRRGQLQQQRRHHDSGHGRRKIEEQSHEEGREQHVGERPRGGPHDVAAQAVGFSEMAEKPADGNRCESCEGKLGQVPEEARGYFDVDAGGGSAEGASPQSRGDRLEEGDSHECRQDDVQGIDAPVVYDLVDHEQECDRRRQGQPLDQEGSDQQLHQYVAAPGEGGAQRTWRGGSGQVSRAGRGKDRDCRHAGPAAPEAAP